MILRYVTGWLVLRSPHTYNAVRSAARENDFTNQPFKPLAFNLPSVVYMRVFFITTGPTIAAACQASRSSTQYCYWDTWRYPCQIEGHLHQKKYNNVSKYLVSNLRPKKESSLLSTGVCSKINYLHS